MVSDKTTLYRFWRADELLYVGISGNAYARMKQHAASSAWFPEADRVTFEEFPDRVTADAAETVAIRMEGPKYNIAKQPKLKEHTRRLLVLEKLTREAMGQLSYLLDEPEEWMRGVLPRVPDLWYLRAELTKKPLETAEVGTRNHFTALVQFKVFWADLMAWWVYTAYGTKYPPYRSEEARFRGAELALRDRVSWLQKHAVDI